MSSSNGKILTSGVMYQEVGTFGTVLGHENRAYEQDKHFINEIIENYLAPSTVKGQREDERMNKLSPDTECQHI